MAKTVRDFDEEKIRDCKEDIDTLLVFVSLLLLLLFVSKYLEYRRASSQPY